MNLYVSGINGTGMGPLALMAVDAGLRVWGSDRAEGAILPELRQHGIAVEVGEQDGTYLANLLRTGRIDWFVYTSSLPPDHPELQLARASGIKVSKRDELINYLVERLGLKMVAVAGTHGKTTTTAMLVWACQQLGIPVSYLVGTTLPFGAAGKYQTGAEFFIYEADEYDRNFLHFHPWLSIITAVSYDHPDIYPTERAYRDAFAQFARQSQQVITDVSIVSPDVDLAGAVRRYDATLALLAIRQMMPILPEKQVVTVLNSFPGVGRRFERLSPGVYSDYAHHPEEIQATVQMAVEEAKRLHLKGVVAVYQPHQNIRQHSVRQGYKAAFVGVNELYWLPTYLTREDPNLPVLTPQELIQGLENSDRCTTAEPDTILAERLKKAQKDGFLVLLMTAGPADQWFRTVFDE